MFYIFYLCIFHLQSILNLKIAVWDYDDGDVFQRVDYMASYIKLDRPLDREKAAWKIIKLKGRVSR